VFLPRGNQDWQLDLNLEILGKDFVIYPINLPNPVILPRANQDYQLDLNLGILGKDKVLYPVFVANPTLSVPPTPAWVLPLSQPLLIVQVPPEVQSSVPSQFPPLPYDKTLYNINWAPIIPPPPTPPAPFGGGIYPSEYQRQLKELYQHMAAVNLGRRGGVSSGISRRGR
jgi:hypothetical protein